MSNITMKYATELDWVDKRYAIESNGFATMPDGERHELLFLDDMYDAKKVVGFDLYFCKARQAMVLRRWQRGTVADAVEEEILIKKPGDTMEVLKGFNRWWYG